MASILLCHSVLGLRQVEHEAAGRWRAAGHSVTLPDLFAGAQTDNLAEGFANLERIGWVNVVSRAKAAAAALPPDLVLAGFSMGTGVVAELLPDVPLAAGVLCFHGLSGMPETVRAGLPVQAHAAANDPFARDPQLWLSATLRAKAAAELFLYDGPGHFFTDRTLVDYEADAAELAWQRSIDFLAAINRR